MFWTENEYVADIAILTWSIAQSVIKQFLSLSQSAPPKNNKSFDTLVQYHGNAFMIVKFSVLKELTSKHNAFLVKLQTGSPIKLDLDCQKSLLPIDQV